MIARQGEPPRYLWVLLSGRVRVVEATADGQAEMAALALQRRLPVAIECSTGIAWSHTPPDTAEEFLREADRDMHERKARERARRETA